MASPTSAPLTKASSDYSYINARIRGMKAELLNETQYEDLLSVNNLDDILEVLENTHFTHHFQLLEARTNSKTLEDVIRRDLCQTTLALLQLVEGRARQLFEFLLLYWDMETIRTLLRGKFAKRPVLEIQHSTLPAGRLSEPLIHELSNVEDVKDLINVLVTWKFPFAKALSKAYPLFEEQQKIFILEHALEKTFFREKDALIGSLDESESSLGIFINDLLDVFNIRTSLRIRTQKLSMEQTLDFFLGKGRRIGKHLFILITQQDSSEAACSLVSSSLNLNEKIKDEFKLEKIIESRLFKKGMKSIVGDPLGFDILFGFFWHKIAEIRNVRILIKGKLAQVHSNRLEEELIYA